MKINEIIRERRQAKQLTQEQMANYLGVTAPAVNKWEKGSSYPDITLLPALARLLDTDLNTLCYPFILNVALWLDGSVMLSGKTESAKEYRTLTESLYQRALCSQDSNIKSQAYSMLISRYMEREEYDKAQELLQQLPEEPYVNKKQLQANLYIACDRLDEAAKLEEEKLLTATNEMHAILITLMEIAIKENRMEDAEYIADVSQKGAELFDLWEYNSYVAQFQLSSACKNQMKCLKVLIPMLKSLTHKWDITRSPLYRHIKTKEKEKGFGPQIRKMIIQSIREDDTMDFLWESKEFQDIIKDMDADCDSKL